MMYDVMLDEDIYAWIRNFQEVTNPIFLSNPDIHSIFIYNQSMDTTFSTYRFLSFEDKRFSELINADEPPPKYEPITSYIEDISAANGQVRVFTYILYDVVSASGHPRGAVAINIKADMSMQSINNL
jgi:hypothetical protein